MRPQAQSLALLRRKITALTYTAPHVVGFFSTAVGVPRALARFPVTSATRYFSNHNHKTDDSPTTPILLSNESPILIINRSSVGRLNESIKCSGGKLANPDVFRGNIVIRETTGAIKRAYAEDNWRHVKIGQEYFEAGATHPPATMFHWRLIWRVDD
jgi:molybdenum cofactor sulfurtransferase